jgi:hypothetical protein
MRKNKTDDQRIFYVVIGILLFVSGSLMAFVMTEQQRQEFANPLGSESCKPANLNVVDKLNNTISACTNPMSIYPCWEQTNGVIKIFLS